MLLYCILALIWVTGRTRPHGRKSAACQWVRPAGRPESLRSLFIAVTPDLTTRLWVPARMPECGILAEAGTIGQHVGNDATTTTRNTRHFVKQRMPEWTVLQPTISQENSSSVLFNPSFVCCSIKRSEIEQIKLGTSIVPTPAHLQRRSPAVDRRWREPCQTVPLPGNAYPFRGPRHS